MSRKPTSPHRSDSEDRPSGGRAPWQFQPYQILQAAIKAVPPVKYALGVAGIVAAIAICASFGTDLRVAAFGTIVTFALMVLLVVFAKLTKIAPPYFLLPVLVMMWTFLILVLATAALLFTSVFFKYPVDLLEWLRPRSVQTLSSNVAVLPAGAVLKVAYTQAPPAPTVVYAKPRLEFGVSARRKGDTQFKALNDGDPLASEVDDYCIVARTLTDGYLYVFQVDSSGKVEWLFPRNNRSRHSTGSNPVASNQTFQIPTAESGEFLYLDNTTGIEHVYACFSASPWSALEDALARSGNTALMGQSPVVEPNRLGTRGVGGTRPVASPSSNDMPTSASRMQGGRLIALPFTSGSLESSGAFVVQELWLRHLDK